MKKYSTANRLKQVMSERNIKQIDILNMSKPYCKKLDIKLGSNSLSQYVNGKVEPRQNTLYLLGQVLNVNEAWLMGYDVPMGRKEQASKENFSSSQDERLSSIIRFYELLNDEGKEQAFISMRNLADIDRYLAEGESSSAFGDTKEKRA